MNNIDKLKSKLQIAVSNRDYVAASKITSQLKIEMNRSERVTLNSMLLSFTEEDKKKSLTLMHKLFVYADLAYGAAVEFEAHLKKFDGSIEIDICKIAKEVAQKMRSITREVDKMGSEEMSDDFGRMCDTISIMAENEIYKHQAKIFKK